MHILRQTGASSNARDAVDDQGDVGQQPADLQVVEEADADLAGSHDALRVGCAGDRPDHHLAAPVAHQFAGREQSITAVVAGADHHQDGAGRNHPLRQFGHLVGGAQHQIDVGIRFGELPFGSADLIDWLNPDHDYPHR